MIDLEIVERAEIPSEWLADAKAYAAIADNASDAWFIACLTRAVLTVQEKADKSLIACTMRVVDDDASTGVRLYQSVKEIIGVTNGRGAVLDYSVDGRMVYVVAEGAVVTYTTQPKQGNVDSLLPVVYQYATALYDGQDSKTLAAILEQCR